MNSQSAIRRYLFKNAGLALFITNFVLVIAIFLIYDPFEWIKTGYQGSAPLIEAEMGDVERVEIGEAPNTFTLLRGEKIKEEAGQKEEKSGGVQGIAVDGSEAYEWMLAYATTEGAKKKVEADRERTGALFRSLNNSRRYYAFDVTSEKLRETGLYMSEGNRCECMTLRLVLSNGREMTIRTGRTTPQNESYVRVDGEESLYLVRENLREASGNGDAEYFRNRRVLPTEVKRESISGIHALFADRRRNVRLGKAGGVWNMEEPFPGRGEADLLAGDLADLSAESFPLAPPSDLDRKNAFHLEIVYTTSLTETSSVAYDVLGERARNTYILRNERGELIEVYSTYIEDLFNPLEKLVKKDSILEKR